MDRNLYQVLGGLFEGAVLSHRTAFEIRPTEGHVYLTYKYDRVHRLPGLVVHLIQGPDASVGTHPFAGGLHISGEARALLENLQPARARRGPSKRLPREWIEDRLDGVCLMRGEAGLNAVRDEARSISGFLDMVAQYEKLEGLVAAILGTGEAGRLRGEQALARAIGLPRDAERVRLFDVLHVALARRIFERRPAKKRSPSTDHLAFFEAYFSNHVEGTVFEIDEARDIVLGGRPDPRRPADSHDIIGTYSVVSDAGEMGRTPGDADDLETLLRDRHATIMAGRPEAAPGSFKERENRAGETLFVRPDLVRGTLRAGFELMTGLREPLARGIHMMFLVSEVHPFVDGNGRLARIMMNSELIAAGEQRILLPIVACEDYMLALRALSRRGNPQPLIRVLDWLHAFTASLDGETHDGLRARLEEARAFREPGEARLRFPDIGVRERDG